MNQPLTYLLTSGSRVPAGTILLGLVVSLLLRGGPIAYAQKKPEIRVSENQRYLVYEDGTPFFWLGGTTWGMSEWLTREEVDYYLDHRQAQGFNLVQVCLFWGKREDDPLRFTTNPPNAYGFQAFETLDSLPDPARPNIAQGGSSENPNDYWDHVDYILQAAAERNMMVGLLPVWGRRYVNATHAEFSAKVFSAEGMRSYGQFLGERYRQQPHIIWVLGGDVKADDGGDYLGHYRAMAEGIIEGITGEGARWNEASPLWDYALMTYHPDGNPQLNSSQWFHQDAWLDFNMIETFKNINEVSSAVRQDYALSEPIKPTVMGEPGYEGFPIQNGVISGLQVRRQAYQSLFGGAAGFTYGGFRDAAGNGPLFSPYEGWEKLLNWEGARTLQFLKSFCQDHHWPDWTPASDIIQSDPGGGELQKVAVASPSEPACFVYFPDASNATLETANIVEPAQEFRMQWFNPASGKYTPPRLTTAPQGTISTRPPGGWSDAVLILRY